MIRQVIKPNTTPNAILSTHVYNLLVGVIDGHLVFACYFGGDKYPVLGVGGGLMGNNDPMQCFPGQCSTPTTHQKQIEFMMSKCDHVYQVENWQDVAEVAKKHDVRTF